MKQRGPSESEVVLTESENLRDAGSGKDSVIEGVGAPRYFPYERIFI